MQRLADLIGRTVDRPQIKETTALGAAYLSGLHAGFFPEPDRFLDRWRLERRFTPQMDAAMRERKLAGRVCRGRQAAGLKAGERRRCRWHVGRQWPPQATPLVAAAPARNNRCKTSCSANLTTW
jgi:FGGY family of carbohydrate kinases, C-terminal domain